MASFRAGIIQMEELICKDTIIVINAIKLCNSVVEGLQFERISSSFVKLILQQVLSFLWIDFCSE